MAATDIASRQIRDGAITDAKVAAGAAIATSKLAEGADFVRRDGSVAFSANQSMGGFKLTNLGAPTAASSDAARISDVEAAIAGLNSAYKYRTVRVASTGNVTISNPATSTFDGVTLTSGDPLLGSILLKNQSTATENGLYLFNGSGSALTRLSNSDAWNEFPGSLVFVNEGTVNANTRWQCTSDDGGTLGSTAIAYTQDVSGGLSSANFVDKETPSGSINGSNTTFTLANTPTTGSEHVYLNGLLQESGSGNDYTISTNTITMLTAPISGDKIRVSYRR
jgi:hypothetical protein